MSSHREAPEISKDPVADNADVYAFVSPDAPGTITIISNFVPLQGPAGGPNFYEFGDDVLYSIYIDNDGDARPDIEYQFQFTSTLRNPNTFLYNTGQVRVARRRELERAPVLHGNPHRRGCLARAARIRRNGRPRLPERPDHGHAARHELGHDPPLPPVQRRGAVDAELRG